MAQLRIERVNSLPDPLQPSTLYYVKGSDSDLVDLYLTGTDVSELRHSITKPEIQTLINSAVSTFQSFLVVQDIAERNALVLTASVLVFVMDATADPTVHQGSAMYVWDQVNSAWYKIAEYESLDIVLDWTNIQGGPQSSPSAIDAAVQASHTHSNQEVLDQLGVTNTGRLTYANQQVGNPLDIVDW